MLTRRQRRIILEESTRGLTVGAITKRHPELKINNKEAQSFVHALGIDVLRQSLAITYVSKVLEAECRNNPNLSLEAASEIVKLRGYNIMTDFHTLHSKEDSIRVTNETFGIKTLFELARGNAAIPEVARELEDLGGVPYFAKTVVPPINLEKEQMVRRMAFAGEPIESIANEFNSAVEDVPGWLQFYLLREFERDNAASAIDEATIRSIMEDGSAFEAATRLDINYFDLMATMGFRPHAGQKQFLDLFYDPEKNCRYNVLLAGRRFGKTVTCSVLATCELFQPKSQVIIVAPNYRNADVIFRNILSLLCDQLNCKLKERAIRERKIVLENNSMLMVISAENAESARGYQPTLTIFEEAATIKNGGEIFEEIIRPAGSTAVSDLGPGRGRVVFIGTPVFGAYLEEYYWAGTSMAGQEAGWHSWSFPSEVNPIVKEAGDVELARKQIGKPGGMSPDTFAREYMAQWAAPDGMIYDEFSVETHIMSLEDFKVRSEGRHVDYILGLDPGFTHPFAATLMAYIHELKEFWAIGCYKQKGKPCSYHNDRIMEMLDEVGITFQDVDFIFYDYASPQAIADLQAAYDEWWASKAVKTVESGQNFIKELLSYQKLYIVEDTAYPLIQEFLAYSYKTTKSGASQVNKTNDDALDALRYAVYTYALSILGDTKEFIPSTADHQTPVKHSEEEYCFL